MKKILVPFDFSEESEKAVYFGHEIAARTKAELLLFHVAEYPSHLKIEDAPNDEETSYFEKILAATEENLKEIVQNPDFRPGLISYELAYGHPFSNISRKISEHQSDLILMGTKGASGIRETFVGSNTERVVRHAHCPVIAVSKKVEFEEINDIVFATNLEENQDFVMGQLKRIQNLFEAKLHLVKINTPQKFSDQWVFKEKMRSFADAYGLENYSVHIYSSTSEEDGIIYYAEEINADMIAIGTHGRTGIDRLFNPSIAEGVANHSKRPVWTCNFETE